MNATEIRLPITGLADAPCAGRVEEELLGLAGVVRASVDARRALATIGYDPTRVGLDDLAEIVQRAGCGAARWERAALRIRPVDNGAPRGGRDPELHPDGSQS
jgi:copper chaperone CopZ